VGVDDQQKLRLVRNPFDKFDQRVHAGLQPVNDTLTTGKGDDGSSELLWNDSCKSYNFD
jgi:hypothetical protein